MGGPTEIVIRLMEAANLSHKAGPAQDRRGVVYPDRAAIDAIHRPQRRGRMLRPKPRKSGDGSDPNDSRGSHILLPLRSARSNVRSTKLSLAALVGAGYITVSDREHRSEGYFVEY